jgi:nucleotide-binding universal stress UspA family protein
MKTVLAPIDLSDAAADVTSKACDLAGVLGARLVLLHVVPPPAVINEYAAESERLAQDEMNEANRRMGYWKQRLAGTSVDADTVVQYGPPVEMILAEAARTKADYIVMGSHGHGALYHLLLGGTVAAVIQKSRSPVMVVPTQKAGAHPSVVHVKAAKTS